MESKTDTTADRYLCLALAFRPPPPDSDPEARAAYARLFVIPGQAIVSPYESVQREGRLMGQAADKVAALYADAGLQLPGHLGELPDHISIEFAFMAHLAGKESNDPTGGERWRTRQRSFLELHLARWLPHLCQQILADDTHTFYHPAARLALQLIEQDRKRLAAKVLLPCAGGYAPLADGPSRSSVQRRFPNITFQIAASLCTLCTLCADTCQRRALSVRCEPRSISLIFDSAACNGCRACLRLCPEGAIRLSRGQALLAPTTEQPRIVHTAARAICPGCKQPHIAVPWLERLQELTRSQETIQSSLVYCPLCKADNGAHSPQPVVGRQEVCAHD